MMIVNPRGIGFLTTSLKLCQVQIGYLKTEVIVGIQQVFLAKEHHDPLHTERNYSGI